MLQLLFYHSVDSGPKYSVWFFHALHIFNLLNDKVRGNIKSGFRNSNYCFWNDRNVLVKPWFILIQEGDVSTKARNSNARGMIFSDILSNKLQKYYEASLVDSILILLIIKQKYSINYVLKDDNSIL